jgi:hypothetical protein
MTATRRVVAGLADVVLCVGGFLVFAVVMALLFGLMHAILGGIAHGLWLNPKGFVGGLLSYGIPCVVSVSLAASLVLKRLLGPLFDRLERWKTLEQ